MPLTYDRRLFFQEKARFSGQSVTEFTTPIDTTEGLERRFRAEGFRPGVPAQIDERTRAVDTQVCRQLRCPGCRKRRMVYRPFTDGRNYRVIASCQNCPAAEEV